MMSFRRIEEIEGAMEGFEEDNEDEV